MPLRKKLGSPLPDLAQQRAFVLLFVLLHLTGSAQYPVLYGNSKFAVNLICNPGQDVCPIDDGDSRSDFFLDCPHPLIPSTAGHIKPAIPTGQPGCLCLYSLQL